MHVAVEDLRLRKLWVVHAGDRAFDLTRQIRALPLSHLLEELEPLRKRKLYATNQGTNVLPLSVNGSETTAQYSKDLLVP